MEITEGTRLMAMAVKACVGAEAVMMAVVLRAMIMVMMVKAKIQVNAGLEERWRWSVRQALVMVAMLMAEVKARVRAAVVNRIAMHAMAVIVAAVADISAKVKAVKVATAALAEVATLHSKLPVANDPQRRVWTIRRAMSRAQLRRASPRGRHSG